jgi:hypothetical protein
MITFNISDILVGDHICRRLVQGVSSVYTLPDRSILLVCNTDVPSKPGIHWVAIYVDEEGHGDYFDSFGRLPTQQFEYYLNAHCARWS